MQTKIAVSLCPLLFVLALASSGCAITPPSRPAGPSVAKLATVDVVVSAPSRNFAYVGPSGVVVDDGQYSDNVNLRAPAVSTSAQAAVAVIGASVFNALDNAATAGARMAQDPVSATVSQIDLSRTFLSELKAAAPPDARPIDVRIGNLHLSYSVALEDEHALLAQLAAQSTADAVLFVRVSPLFRGFEHSAAVDTKLILMTRDGGVLFSENVRLLGVEPGGRSTEDLVSWWADQRFRRFLLLGTRAAAVVSAKALWSPLSSQQSLDEYTGMVEGLSPRGLDPIFQRSLFSDSCSLAGDNLKTQFRFVRLKMFLRVAARCSGAADTEGLTELPWQEVWRSRVFPAVPVPALRKDA